MKHSTYKVVAGGVALLAVAICAASLRTRSGSASSSASDSGREQRQRLEIRLGGRPGGNWRHDLQLTTSAELGGSRILAVELHARLATTSVAKDGQILVRVRLENPMLTSSAGEQAVGSDSLRSIEAQLGQAFEYELAERGAIGRVWLPNDMHPMASRLLRSIIAYTQVVLPENGSWHDGWQVDESDLSGDFRVRYDLAAEPNAVSKRKLALVRSRANAGPGIRTKDLHLDHSDGQIRFDEAGAITDIRYAEKIVLAVESGPSGLEATSQTQFALRNGRPTPDVVIVSESSSAPRVAQQFYAEPVPKPHSQATDAARIGGRTVRDILAARRLVDRKSEQGKEASARLQIAAAALFRQSSQALGEATKVIRRGGDDASFFIHALGAAGTEAAGEALVDVLKTTTNEKLKRAALAALGQVSHPSQAALNAIEECYQDPNFGGFARLMAGAMARSAREEAPQVTAAAVDSLLKVLSQESKPLYVADDLRALGNSGHPRATDAAVEYAQSPDATVRAAAAQAVRQVNGPAADDLLIRLSTDTSVSVRSSALNAALYTRPSAPLIAAVEQAARVDSEASVRRDAVRVLVTWQQDQPPVRQTLAWVSTNDSNDKVRAVALEGLHRFD
jgi:HEAT repeat protein